MFRAVELRLIATTGTLGTASTRFSTFDLESVSKDFGARTRRAVGGECERREMRRMVLPPPNVTGQLHLGHALTVTVEDAFARHWRMHGIPVQWLPGFDHAGIATQTVVERQLWKEKRMLRKHLNPTQFLAYCEAWAKKNSMAITEQLKRLGASLDWENVYYTLDPRFSRAVTHAFVRLHREGLISRQKRVINWCPALQSSLSDQEVSKLVVEGPTELEVPARDGGRRKIRVGVMHRVRYELLKTDGESLTFLEVATTRPETIFADVALAVHPDDTRYNRFVGERVQHPLMRQRTLPVIADAAVKPDKGTGVLKITPAHDPLDEAIAKRHLEELDSDAMTRSCVDETACIHGVPGYPNMDRFDARIKVLRDLEKVGSYGGETNHRDGVVHVCTRTGDVIEPRLTSQWFLDTLKMHREAKKALNEGKLVLHPAYERSNMLEWLYNEEPWCLSRQLFWGHRIPAYRRNKAGAWIVAETPEEAAEMLTLEQGETPLQDTDVLDTWFSSALVPLVTAGWPEKTPERPPIYMMETGHDILGFWVARMVLLTQRLANGVLPFERVLLHGMVRDGEGRKMSKSLGNVVDPLDVVDGISLEKMLERLQQSNLSKQEIEEASEGLRKRFPTGMPACGADALRFALLRHDVTAVDVPIDVARLADEGARFCTKLSNLAAYVKRMAEAAKGETVGEEELIRPEDLWLRSRVAVTGKAVNVEMEANAPHLAFGALHKLILANICDVYLETTKQALWKEDKRRCAAVTRELKRALAETFTRLMAFMPFIAEQLYKEIIGKDIYEKRVQVVEADVNEALERRMNLALAVVATVRSLRTQLQLPSNIVFQGILQGADPLLIELKEMIRNLCGLDLETIKGETPEGYMTCTVPGHSATLSVRIEESHRAEFVERMQRQLVAAEERKRAFEEIAIKSEELSRRDDGKLAKKSARKAANARTTVEKQKAEIERLKKLIGDVEEQKKERNENAN